MAINFIPNDPLAGTGAPAMRQVSAARQPAEQSRRIYLP